MRAKFININSICGFLFYWFVYSSIYREIGHKLFYKNHKMDFIVWITTPTVNKMSSVRENYVLVKGIVDESIYQMQRRERGNRVSRREKNRRNIFRAFSLNRINKMFFWQSYWLTFNNFSVFCTMQFRYLLSEAKHFYSKDLILMYMHFH